MATTVLISAFAPFPSFTLTLSSDTPLAELPSYLPKSIPTSNVVWSAPSGHLSLDSTPLRELWDSSELVESGNDALLHQTSGVSDNGVSTRSPHSNCHNNRLVTLRLSAHLLGGKGGFGSQLRAAGGRMSSQKTNNNDSCRDLNGRRLSTIKEAKALAAYLESEPERQKAQQEAQRAKLEKLERRLGIDEHGKAREEGGSASNGGKRRFDDTEYIEQSKDIVDNVKSAVTAGLLKKRKKAKTTPPPAEASGSNAEAESSSAKSAENPAMDKDRQDSSNSTSRATAEVVEKALESPLTAPVSAGAAVSLAAIGA